MYVFPLGSKDFHEIWHAEFYTLPYTSVHREYKPTEYTAGLYLRWLKLDDNNNGQLHQVLMEILHQSGYNEIQFTARLTGVFARYSSTKRRTFSAMKNRTYFFHLRAGHKKIRCTNGDQNQYPNTVTQHSIRIWLWEIQLKRHDSSHPEELALLCRCHQGKMTFDASYSITDENRLCHNWI